MRSSDASSLQYPGGLGVRDETAHDGRFAFRKIHAVRRIAIHHINAAAIPSLLRIKRSRETERLDISSYRSFGNTELRRQPRHGLMSAPAKDF